MQTIEDVENAKIARSRMIAQKMMTQGINVYEGFYFYLHRHDRNNGYNIRARMIFGTSDLVHQPDYYLPNTHPRHCVRVPALMVATIPNIRDKTLNPKGLEEDLDNFFNHFIRRQVGTHLFVSTENTGTLWGIKTVWVGNERTVDERRLGLSQGFHRSIFGPDDWSNDPIHCAYPCYVTDNRVAQPSAQVIAGIKFELLLGIAFVPRNQSNLFRRSYCRFEDELPNNCCQDIGPEFIAKPSTQQINYQNLRLFQHIDDKYHNRIAFYVCRGGRIVVQDNRIKGGKYISKKTGKTKAHRCFYQQGSLVVIYAGGHSHQFDICINPMKDNSLSWSDLADNVLEYFGERPAQRDLDEFEERHDGPQRRDGSNRINRMRDKVLFLGGVDSQFESLCWRISIRDSKRDPKECQYYLEMPDGGVIQDVAPWETGFALIRARCHYEQSWRNIVEVPILPTQTHQPDPFPFLKPLDDTCLRRILGLEYNPMIVEYPRERFDLPEVSGEHENLFREYYRFNEYLVEWSGSPLSDQMSPPPPPLYPPAKHSGQYGYPVPEKKVLLKGFCDHSGQKKRLYSIEGFQYSNNTDKLYHLQHVRNTEGWPWVKYTNDVWALVDPFRTGGQHNFITNKKLWIRESIDRVKYVKNITDAQSAQSLYKIDTLYLEMHICPNHPPPPPPPPQPPATP